MRLLSLALLACLALGTVCANAQDDQAARRAASVLANGVCDEFAKQHCPGLQGNERRQCLESNMDKVSPGCKAMISVKPPAFPGPGVYPR